MNISVKLNVSYQNIFEVLEAAGVKITVDTIRELSEHIHQAARDAASDALYDWISIHKAEKPTQEASA